MIVRDWGLIDWQTTEQAMRAWTHERTDETPDELWLAQHPPVFTLGLAAQAHHLIATGDIPVRASNRGGQVTFHGPGQLVAYPLVNLRRRGIYVKEFVYRLEASILGVLEALGLTGHRVPGAPGIYIRMDAPHAHQALTGPARSSDPFAGLGKVAALGIKVSRHCTYHGAALNVAMDLEPYQRINPCGYPGLRTVDLRTLGVTTRLEDVSDLWQRQLIAKLGQ